MKKEILIRNTNLSLVWRKIRYDGHMYNCWLWIVVVVILILKKAVKYEFRMSIVFVNILKTIRRDYHTQVQKSVMTYGEGKRCKLIFITITRYLSWVYLVIKKIEQKLDRIA